MQTIKSIIQDKKGALKIGPFGSQLQKSTFVTEGFKVYGQENIFNNDFNFGERYISQQHFDKLKSNELIPGDFIISTMGTIGKCSIVPTGISRGIMDSHIIRLQINNDVIFSFFLSQLFCTHLIAKQIKALSVGGIMDGLSIGIINELIFKTPSLYEQTKIANFLYAVDEKIVQLSRKCELLTLYKKGVMQQIFSQQLRFKPALSEVEGDDDGKDFPEWDVVELGQIACKVNKKNKDSSLTTVLTNSATQGIVSQSDYFDRDIANQNNLGGYYIVELDDFVYNPRISVNAPVGPIKRNKLTTGVMSPLYTVFRFKEGNLVFLEQYFQTSHWHDYMKSISNLGARYDRMNISNECFFELPIPYPSMAEQTKIANFLTALDDKISHAQAQLAAVKQYKQGLLQQMFV